MASKKYEIIKCYSDKETKQRVKKFCEKEGMTESELVKSAVNKAISGDRK